MKNIALFLGGVVATLVIVSMTGMPKWPKNPDRSGMKMEGMDMGMKMDMAHDTDDTKGQAAVTIAPQQRQLIGVKTDLVREQGMETAIRAVGTVDYDERRLRQVTLRVSGFITKLHADFTSKTVKKGEPLLTPYSPELASTQQEYLLAKKTLDRIADSPAHIREGAEAQVELARNRLRLWNLTDRQILGLSEKLQTETVIYSPASGVITKKMAVSGMHITPEMNLYEIADLSTVWVYADIYEQELSHVKQGQEATVTLAAYPGERFSGRVIYIDPYLNKETRTVRVRMEFSNGNGQLKPGMFGNVALKVAGGRGLAIPEAAVLDSGTQKLVFVETGDGVYEPRAVTLGGKQGNLYPVLSGLSSGEKIVTSATFLIDSESKLMAATNMMGALGMGGIKVEQAKMGAEMEMKGMNMPEMKMDDMPGMKMGPQEK